MSQVQTEQQQACFPSTEQHVRGAHGTCTVRPAVVDGVAPWSQVYDGCLKISTPVLPVYVLRINVLLQPLSFSSSQLHVTMHNQPGKTRLTSRHPPPFEFQESPVNYFQVVVFCLVHKIKMPPNSALQLRRPQVVSPLLPLGKWWEQNWLEMAGGR